VVLDSRLRIIMVRWHEVALKCTVNPLSEVRNNVISFLMNTDFATEIEFINTCLNHLPLYKVIGNI